MLSRYPIHDETQGNEMLVNERRTNINIAREYTVPVDFRTIYLAQLEDPTIQRLQREAPHRLGRIFDNTGERSGPQQAITVKDMKTNVSRILVPENMRHRLIHWYHHMLVHPGMDRLFNTLFQHFTWPRMRQEINDYTKVCPQCQKGKRGLKGYGEIPLKDVETEPWKDVCIDLSGPWSATISGKTVEFHALTIIDPFTSWVEIVPIHTKRAPYIRDQILQQWLRRYPRPARIIFDQGGEFDNAWLFALCKRWNITPVPTTTMNPRANAIVERMHKIMADMIRCQMSLRHQDDDPVRDMLSAIAYAIRSTVHGTTQYTPGQLVFSKDMILRTHMEADIRLIQLRRQQMAKTNNTRRENKRRIKHSYEPGDKVLILPSPLEAKLTLNQGPFAVVNYDKATGTLQIRRKNYIESINIRRVRPYFGHQSGGD